jgi:hypothetical protein
MVPSSQVIVSPYQGKVIYQTAGADDSIQIENREKKKNIGVTICLYNSNYSETPDKMKQ